jgi:hypothetical protein
VIQLIDEALSRETTVSWGSDRSGCISNWASLTSVKYGKPGDGYFRKVMILAVSEYGAGRRRSSQGKTGDSPLLCRWIKIPGQPEYFYLMME